MPLFLVQATQTDAAEAPHEEEQAPGESPSDQQEGGAASANATEEAATVSATEEAATVSATEEAPPSPPSGQHVDESKETVEEMAKSEVSIEPPSPSKLEQLPAAWPVQQYEYHHASLKVCHSSGEQ